MKGDQEKKTIKEVGGTLDIKVHFQEHIKGPGTLLSLSKPSGCALLLLSSGC